MRRVTRDLLDAQVLVGDARDLRQVRDGQHLRPPGEPAQDVGHPVRGDAADPGVDLVEDHRLAARDGCDGEGDARELAARGRLGHGCERKPGVGADEEDHLVGARHPWLALPQLHVELALPQAEIGELVRHGRRERARRFPAGIRERACGAVEPRLRGVPVGARPLERVAGRPHVLQLGQRRGTPFEQLVEARRTMAPLRVRDPVEPLLDLRHPGGIGVERVGEASHVAPDLAQADDEVAQLAGRGLELGREALERRKRTLGSSGEGAGAVPVVRLDRRHGGLGTLAELGDVSHPLAFRAERLLLARLEPLGVLDQQSELGEPLPLGVCAALEVVESPCGGGERAPGVPGLAATHALVGPDEGVEQVELVGRAREPPLRELPGECQQPVGGGHEVVAGDAATPGVRPGAPVGGDAPGDHEAGLVVGPKLPERLEPLLVEEPLRDVQLGLDVRLGTGGADGGGVALRAEEEPDRLRDDRLARAGLARESDEPRSELEVRFADQDEVLDPEPS